MKEKLWLPDSVKNPCDKYGGSVGEMYAFYGTTGYTSLPVLNFLWGKLWDELALKYIHSVNPTLIRVIKDGCPETTDSVHGRVTIYLKEDGKTIHHIKQEVSVAGGCGHDVNCEYKKRYGEYP